MPLTKDMKRDERGRLLKKRQLTRDLAAQVLQLRGSGWTVRRIAAKVGIPTTSAFRLLKEALRRYRLEYRSAYRPEPTVDVGEHVGRLGQSPMRLQSRRFDPRRV